MAEQRYQAVIADGLGYIAGGLEGRDIAAIVHAWLTV